MHNGNDKIEKKRLAILAVLKESKEPLGSQKITELLNHMRHDIRERTVRFHLNLSLIHISEPTRPY